VRLIDANVLLYADNEDAQQHDAALLWLERALQGAQTLVVPWISALAYLRISTHGGIHATPNSIETAVAFLRTVLEAPNVIPGEPDGRHLDRLHDLLRPLGQGGNLVNDAHIAALALQYEATVVSFDNDFSRFAGVRWERPRPVTEN
jgi:toxin-antitoxin system PIN domain toxin